MNFLAQSAAASGGLFSTPVKEEWIGIIAISGVFIVALVAIVGGLIRSSIRTRAKEQSRREIAAYVAEGSMSPADAERILEAGMPHWERPKKV